MGRACGFTAIGLVWKRCEPHCPLTLCFCLRFSFSGFPQLCSVVRSERPLWNSITSAPLPWAAFELCPHILVSSPLAASPGPIIPTSGPALTAPLPTRPSARLHPQRRLSPLKRSPSRPAWLTSRWKAAGWGRDSPPSSRCGSEARTRRASMKSTFSSITRMLTKSTKGVGKKVVA